jgi:hypothetical protein
VTIQLNEPVIHALRDRLEADLPAVISQINADSDDDFTLADPVAVHGFVPPIALLEDFPTVGIGDAPSRFEDDVGHSATGRHELIVIAYLQDEDQEALAWRLRRYSQALVRVALAGRNLGDAAWGTGLVSVSPGPTLGDDPENPQTFASWVGVRMWANRDEE